MKRTVFPYLATVALQTLTLPVRDTHRSRLHIATANGRRQGHTRSLALDLLIQPVFHQRITRHQNDDFWTQMLTN